MANKQSEPNKIKLTLVRSICGRIPRHRETARCLGLKRINQSVTVNDIPSVRGMINQVSYLLKVEEV